MREEKSTIQADVLPNTAALTELWLHYYWWGNKLSGQELHTVDGRRLRIEFPGWYNRGWGPDFVDARIEIDDFGMFGDIEIHIKEQSWREHEHHTNEAYNRVILHVFIDETLEKTRNQLGQEIPALNLSRYCPDLTQGGRIRYLESLKEELPGACGLSLRPSMVSRIRAIVFQASENRVLEKTRQLKSEMKDRGVLTREDILFASICRSIGYSAFADTFHQMAKVFPYSYLSEFSGFTVRQKKTEVLGRWFGFIGLFERFDSDMIQPDLRREWHAMRKLWEKIIKTRSVDPVLQTKASRPLNHPARRLLGLFYHLEKVSFEGLLKSWLKFIMDCGDIIQRNKNARPLIISRLDEMFPQPKWEPLNETLSPASNRKLESRHRLVGKERQVTILVNSIIPFFIDWSEENGAEHVKKTLFALLLILPAENANHKTRFMEKRLLSCHPDLRIKKNLSYYQGLIQLYDDCCSSFYEGCENCSLLRMINT